MRAWSSWCSSPTGLTRYAAPYADPLFLPLAIFLNGIGLVLIHRLDIYDTEHFQALHKLNPVKFHTAPTGSTTNQLMYTALGIIVMAVFLLFIKDHKVLQRYAYISMVSGLFLVALPAMLPASMSSRNGAKSWVFLPGGVSIQPAEFGKLLLVSFFAAFLMAKRDALRVASRRVLGLNIPRGRDMGPIAVCWVLAMLILVFETDLGVSLMFFGAFVVLLYIATERTSWLVFGVTAFIGGAVFIATTVPHVQARVNNWLHPFTGEICARTAAPGELPFGPDLPVHLRLRHRRHLRQGPEPGPALAGRVRQERGLHPGHGRRGARHGRAVRADDGLHAVRDARLQDRAADPRQLRQAARGRSGRDVRAAGVHHRRRRHACHPADRSADAVPGRRRFGAGGELGRGGAVDQIVRLRAAPAAAGDPADRRRAAGDAAGGRSEDAVERGPGPARPAGGADSGAGGPPRPHPLAQPGLGQTGLAQSGLGQTGLDAPGGPEEPAPPGASDPTEPMPVRRAAAAAVPAPAT